MTKLKEKKIDWQKKNKIQHLWLQAAVEAVEAVEEVFQDQVDAMPLRLNKLIRQSKKN